MDKRKPSPRRLSARVMPNPSAPEGVGNAGRQTRPQPCVQKVESTQASHHGRARSPGIPARDGFNGLWRASPAIASAMRSIVATRDASVEASGPHAFAVRKHTPSSIDVAHVHRIPAQRFVTTAKRPSYRAGTARSSRDDLPDGLSEIFLRTGLDIAARQSAGDLPVGQIGARSDERQYGPAGQNPNQNGRLVFLQTKRMNA
jgi:hypothetical protein